MNRALSDAGSPQLITDAPPARPRARLEWLDFLRGLAVLVMIETHVVNTFLAGSFREGSAFTLLNYVNGLVAPSFLFIAGFVQGMERRQSPGKPINYGRRFRRLLGIAVLGYALHFPVGELLQHRWADALRIGSQVDVLQCLALGLMLLLGVSWLADKVSGTGAKSDPSEPTLVPAWLPSFTWSAGVVILAMATVLAAPLVQGWIGGPIALRAWVNDSTGSLFPVFPWIGFVFLGALAGAWPTRPLTERAAAIASLALVAGLTRGPIFSAVSPSFFLERAAWVLALAAVCEWQAHRPLPAFVRYAGSNSLKFYVTHLALITALVALGVPSSAFGLPAALAFIALVLAASFAVPHFLELLPRLLRSRPPAAPDLAPDLASPAS